MTTETANVIAVSNRVSDADIIRRSTSQAEAFGLLFDRHGPDVGRYLSRRVAGDQVESLLADVFVIAFEQRNRFDPIQPSALPWLYGIARNLVRHHHRSASRERNATQRLASLVAVDGRSLRTVEELVQANTDSPGNVERILAAVDRQPEIDREVLLLTVWEGLTQIEVAEALVIPVGTVKSRLNRVRRNLRRALS